MGYSIGRSASFVGSVWVLIVAAGLGIGGAAQGASPTPRRTAAKAPGRSAAGSAAARPAGPSRRSVAPSPRGAAAAKPSPAPRVSDQVEIRVTPFPGPAGAATPAEFVLHLADNRGVREVKSQGGKVSVPPGDYWITGWTVTVPDAQGRRWKARGGILGAPPLASHVPARRGYRIEIRLAAPLGAAVVPTVKGRTVNFVMTFVGTAGDRCYEVSVDDQRPPLPHMRILDAHGQLVERLDFSFG
jgi:hypothetical protein